MIPSKRPKTIVSIIGTILLLFISASLAGQVNVTRVTDGDTLKAAGHDIEIKVRLIGIDAAGTSRKKN
jgi:endonuclease YncB( thermonuclease family)